MSDSRQSLEYRLGAREVHPDYVGRAPRQRAITRPDLQRPWPEAAGPTLADFARLEAGEIHQLSFAAGGRRFRVDRLLGKGGTAAVYAGVLEGVGRPVALKILTTDLHDDVDALARFTNEARLGAKVDHPNVVEVIDFGSTREGIAYLAMQLLDGEDLRTTLAREGALSWARVRVLLVQLARALAAIHEQGIVHRDLKPANCLRVVEGGYERVLLTDFGVACRAGDCPDATLIGTPEYMSPEQAAGRGVDARSDLYALGILLGELLTGRVPFRRRSVSATLDAIVHDAPPSLARLAGNGTFIPAGLESVWARALAKRPEERFGSASEFEAALMEIELVTVVSRSRLVRPTPRSTPVVAKPNRTLIGRPFAGESSSRWLALAL